MRTLREIAQDVEQDWKPISPYARPYVNAMHTLVNIGDHYGADEGSSIVNYFLSNAGSWKGEKAKAVKKELKDMLKTKRASLIAAEILATIPKKIAREILASGTVPNFVKFADEYVVEDYPYGQLKTKATFKVEKKSNQERVERITIDPKTGRINKPKYTPFYEKAKLGITSDNKVYPVTGRLDIIVVWNDDMQHEIASLMSNDPDFNKLSKELSIIKKASNEIKVKKIPNGAVIELNGNSIKYGEILELSGITPERKKDIYDIKRENSNKLWKITFQHSPETFIIKIRK